MIAMREAIIEANGAAFLMEMGRAAGGEQRDDHLRWTIGGSPIDYRIGLFEWRE